MSERVAEDELKRWGRACIGAALGELRRRADLKTGAMKVLKDSMVRNIESGQTPLPLAKTRKYAHALSVNTRRGEQYVNGDNLVEAYVALEEAAAGESSSSIEWSKYYQEHNPRTDPVKDILVQYFTRRPVDGMVQARQDSEIQNLLQPLNPFQFQLLRDIAQALPKIGSNIVQDQALAEWEDANFRLLKSVRAIVTSLESELGPAFIASISQFLGEPTFEGLEYYVIGERTAVARTSRKLKENLYRSAGLSGKTKAEIHKILRKVRLLAVDPEARDILARHLEYEPNRGWDAVYMYERTAGDHLLIGVFRRAPPYSVRMDDVSLESWGAMPMNEALPSYKMAAFVRALEEVDASRRHKVVGDGLEGSAA